MYVGDGVISNIEKFLKEIKVYDCSDMTKIRLGNKSDGGYVVLKEICDQTGVLYSFGVGDDVGFELDFVDLFPGAGVKLFDPTIDRLPINHPNFNFTKSGISKEKLNQVNRNSLLKIDVEWDEWEVLYSLEDEILSRFNQILIEFHVSLMESRRSYLSPYFQQFYQSVTDKINCELANKYFTVMRRLTNQFYIYHIHANNSLQKVQLNGNSFPPLIEISFVRKDLVKTVSLTTVTFPIEGLDCPNKTDRPDIKDFYPLC
jgi:hypothetical protein